MTLQPGQRYGRWVLLQKGQRRPYAQYWLCRCDCGTEREVSASTLYFKNPHKSCGCWRREIHTKHGLSRTPEYVVWRAMQDRCYNRNQTSWPPYGGRGITVCDRWRGPGGFSNFIADMGRRPSPEHTIERRENDGPYSPENCYWATRTEQANNKRNNRILSLNGVSKTLPEWCRQFRVSQTLIWKRLHRGWPVERALSTPSSYVEKPRTVINLGGVEKPLTEWAREYGIDAETVRSRLGYGWPPEGALSTAVGAIKKWHKR